MSRFVPAGGGGAGDDDPVNTNTEAKLANENDAWRRAQEQVATLRKPKPLDPNSQDAGKSLYQVLQENKAAKQEAFEESARLKNQFRPLDQSEVEFLDAVDHAARLKEEAVKRETAEQLDFFRKQQAGVEGLTGSTRDNRDSGAVGDKNGKGEGVAKDVWTVTNKKRKRDKTSSTHSGPPGLKQQRTLETELNDVQTWRSPDGATITEGITTVFTDDAKIKEHQTTKRSPSAVPKHDTSRSAESSNTVLGLVAYDSDDE